MSRIFISYRRAETHAVTDRIYDHLSAQFGASALFKDVDNIPIGDQFPSVIAQAITQCAVVLVIIGPNWARIPDESGQPRLNNPDDFVRQEVETGLRHNKRVIPVLVEDALMPAPDDLPSSLRPLTERNAVTIRHDPYFREDIARLTAGITKSLGRRAIPAPLSRFDWRILAVAALAILSMIVALIVSNRDSSGTQDKYAALQAKDGQVQIIESGTGVFFLPSNSSGENHGVTDGQWISSGGTLTTFQDTVVRVNFALSAFSTVMPSAWVQLNNIVDSSEPMAFTIENSELFVFTGAWPGAVVRTLNGARATVTGSEMWITDEQGTITVACFSGSCSVADSTDKVQDLDSGFMVTFDSAGGDLLDTTYSPQPIVPSDITAYNRRCGSCIPVVSAPPVAGRVLLTTDGWFDSPNFFAVDTDGSDLIILEQPDIRLEHPVWSPDGKRIAFAGSSISDQYSPPQIYALDADGANLARLTDLEKGADWPDWSPDGTQIVFVSGTSDIFIMDEDGSNVTQLTDDRYGNAHPAWSPDGNRIAFESSSYSDSEIVVIERDGWPRLNVTRSRDNREDYPAWSPDGSQIAFVSDRDGNNEIYVMNADGTDPVNLTQHEANDQYPVWLPDGHHIVFISDRDESLGKEAYIMNTDGSDVVPILDFWGQPPYPAGYEAVNQIDYLDWQPSGADVAQPLAPVSIAPETLGIELAWRVASHPGNWGEGSSSTSGEMDVNIIEPDSDCTLSATYDYYAGYNYTSDMGAVSVDNVTYDASTDTFTVTLPGGFVAECDPVELEMTEQSSTCSELQTDLPDLDVLAIAQAQMARLQRTNERLTGFEDLFVRAIEADLSNVTGASNLVIVFDRELSPPLPDSCLTVIPDGWQYDHDNGVWEPVAMN